MYPSNCNSWDNSPSTVLCTRSEISTWISCLPTFIPCTPLFLFIPASCCSVHRFLTFMCSRLLPPKKKTLHLFLWCFFYNVQSNVSSILQIHCTSLYQFSSSVLYSLVCSLSLVLHFFKRFSLSLIWISVHPYSSPSTFLLTIHPLCTFIDLNLIVTCVASPFLHGPILRSSLIPCSLLSLLY